MELDGFGNAPTYQKLTGTTNVVHDTDHRYLMSFLSAEKKVKKVI
jgi:hypothetical protein